MIVHATRENGVLTVVNTTTGDKIENVKNVAMSQVGLSLNKYDGPRGDIDAVGYATRITYKDGSVWTAAGIAA